MPQASDRAGVATRADALRASGSSVNFRCAQFSSPLIDTDAPMRRMIGGMTETPESRARPNTMAGPPWVRSPQQGQGGRPSGLSQVLAWVGIVAGVVFVVAVIFFWFLVGL